MLDVSRLVEKIIAGPNGKNVIGFGDQAYTLTEHVQCPWSALSLMGPEGVARVTYNASMSSCRISVENFFGLMANLFPYVHHGRKHLQILKSTVGVWYKAALLLVNMYTCLNGNNIQRQYGVASFHLERYLQGRLEH